MFAARDLHSSPALSTAFSTHATSFSSTPLDTAVVERVVRSHLKEATRDALDDLLHSAGVDITTKPAKDLVDTIASLVAEASDGEARSQTLVAGLLRVGTTAWIEGLLRETPIFETGTCTASDDLLNAAYEGLAASQYLRPLGFPKADGKFANADCAKVAGNVAMMIDTISRFPNAARVDALSKIGARTRTLFDAKASACTAATIQLLPAEAQTAIAHLRGVAEHTSTGGGHEGSPSGTTGHAGASEGSAAGSSTTGSAAEGSASVATTSATDSAPAADSVDELDIASLRDVYDAVKLVKSFANTVSPAQRAAYGKCLDEFVTFGQSFEDSLLRFSADVEVGVQLADLKPMLQRVSTIVARIKPAELAAMQSLLVRLIDGRALRRGDVVLLLNFIDNSLRPKLSAIHPPEAGTLLLAVLDSLPQAIREDATAPAGIRMDVPALASTLVSRFSRQRERGVYFRATVGTGYAFTAGEGSRKADTATTFHEEIGVGYRWQRGSLLHGPHLMTSGILFNVVENGVASNQLFVGAGYSVNLYHLIDVSASAGRFFNLSGNGADSALLVSLQIPIFDYLGALTEGGDVTQTSPQGGSR